MDDIGEKLRIAREARNISLREVENITKIRMKYLIALEANDFDALPGRAYLFGFLRTYARFLGLNDEELVHSLKKKLPTEVQHEERRSVKRKKNKARTKKPNIFALISILLAVLIIGRIGMAFWGDRNSDDPNNEIIGSQTDPKTADDLEPPETQNDQSQSGEVPDTSASEETSDNNLKTDPEADINGVSVTVIIKEDSCWIGVTIDDKKDFQGTLTAGENRTFVGQEKIVIKYGNAGAVEVITNGDRIYPVGSKNQVVTKEYPEINE